MPWLVRERRRAGGGGGRRDRVAPAGGACAAATDVEGALVLRPCRNVHTVGMRFAIDVAFCDRDGIVIRTCCLRPWRLSPFVPRAALAIEARSGAFERWDLHVGDKVEVKE